MNQTALRASSQISAADWIEPRLAPFASCVSAVVPGGFAAYVRILHPARDPQGTPLRWSDVARRTGRTMHRLAQFHALARSAAGEEVTGVELPDCGDLASPQLRALCTAMKQHTSTPEACFFCLWEGFGWLQETQQTDHIVFPPAGTAPSVITETGNALEGLTPTALREAVRSPLRVPLPAREYLLLEGPLSSAGELGWRLGTRFQTQSPNLFWPEDRAWCVATEIDLFCTLVGGSEALAAQLLADPQLEAWPVSPDDPISADSDQVNR